MSYRYNVTIINMEVLYYMIFSFYRRDKLGNVAAVIYIRRRLIP